MASLVRELMRPIWRKTLMSVAAIFWMGFVLTHMLGNLMVFAGAETYNRYSHALVHNPFLPVAEGALVLFLLVHALTGIGLWIENRKATPQKYALAPKGVKAVSLAPRAMAFTGALVAAFLVFHVATFKYGPLSYVTYSGTQVRDLYALVAGAFQSWTYVGWYFIALCMIGVHLFHGFSSVFQTLGFYHPRYTPIIKMASVVYAVFVVAGFLALPLYFKLFT